MHIKIAYNFFFSKYHFILYIPTKKLEHKIYDSNYFYSKYTIIYLCIYLFIQRK